MTHEQRFSRSRSRSLGAGPALHVGVGDQMLAISVERDERGAVSDHAVGGADGLATWIWSTTGGDAMSSARTSAMSSTEMIDRYSDYPLQ